MSWKPCDRTRIPWSLDCLYNVACLPVETNAGDDRQDAGPDAEARWWRGRRLKRWKWVRSFCDSCDPFVYFVASSESFICTQILFCGHKLVFARVLYWYAVAAIKFPSPVSWLVLHTEVLIIFFILYWRWFVASLDFDGRQRTAWGRQPCASCSFSPTWDQVCW